MATRWQRSGSRDRGPNGAHLPACAGIAKVADHGDDSVQQFLVTEFELTWIAGPANQVGRAESDGRCVIHLTLLREGPGDHRAHRSNPGVRPGSALRW